GPEPTGCVATYASPFSRTYFGGTIGIAYARLVTSVGNGRLVTMRSVSGSTTSTRSMSTNAQRQRAFWSGFTTPSMLHLTASASRSSPLWTFTPRRSLNSQVVGFTAAHETATPGSWASWPSFTVRRTRWSKTLCTTANV